MGKRNLWFCTFLFLLLPSFFSLLPAQTVKNNQEKIVEKAREKYLRLEKDEQVFRFYDDTTIKEGEVLNGHVMIIHGDLKVRGEVNGDILAIWGDVEVFNTGRVHGNVTSVGGTVEVYDNGVVDGEMLQTNVKNLIGKNVRVTRKFRSRIRKDQYGTLPLGENMNHFIFKYNRVEGAFLGLQVPKKLIPEVGHFSFYGFLGYGFESAKWRFQIGLDRWFIDPLDYRLELGIEFHDLTDTKDLWRIPYFENTLAALFLREDFMDYFRRQGYSVHLSQNLTPYFKATLEYRNDDYATMPVGTNWSFFGGNKRFRPALVLDPALQNMRSVYGELYFDNRDEVSFTTTGWYARIGAEVTSDRLGGDYRFKRYQAEVRHFLPVSTGENLNIRLMVGTSEGSLPVQKDFELGGISTLRGFRYKELVGNSLILVNLEYRIHSKILGAEIPFFGDWFSLVLFTDFGNAWQAPENYRWNERLRMLTWKAMKNDVGIAIADPEGAYRLNIARRTDTGGSNFVITFRITQPF